MAVHGLGILAVDGDGALVHVVEAHQQVDEGALAAAGGSYDGGGLAGFYVEVEVFDEFLVFYVGEVHVLDIHFAVFKGQLRLGIRALGLGVDEGKYPGGAGHGVLELGDYGADVGKGFHILVGVVQQYGQVAYGNGAAEDPEGAQKGHQGVDDVIDGTGGGVGQGAVEQGVLGIMLQVFVQDVKLFRGFGFVPKGLHHFFAAHHFVDQGGLAAPNGGLLAEHMVGMGGDKLGGEETDGGQHHDHQGDFHVLGEHDVQSHQDGDDAGKQLGKAQQQAVRDLVHIGNDPLHQVADALAVQIGQGEHLDLADGLGPDIPDGAVGQPVVDEVHNQGGQAGQGHQGDNPGKIPAYQGEVHPAGTYDAVDGPAKEHGYVQLQHHADAGQHDAKDQKNPVGVNDVQDFFRLLGSGSFCPS